MASSKEEKANIHTALERGILAGEKLANPLPGEEVVITGTYTHSIIARTS